MKKIIIMLILVAILTTGCISGTESSGQYTSTTRVAQYSEAIATPSTSVAMMTEKSVSPTDYETADYETPSTTTTRKVITTTNIRLEIKELENRLDTIASIAYKYDGFVSNSYVNAYDEYKTGSITIRVPSVKHDVSVKEITDLGKVKSKSTSGRDVTEEYIDLNSRLRNLNREEERLLEILKKAEEVKDFLDVEKELARVRGEIELLTGRKKYLDDRIEYSTIVVELKEPAPVTYDWGIRETLISAIEGFFETITSLIILFGYLLPIGIVLAIIVKIKRHRGSKETTK